MSFRKVPSTLVLRALLFAALLLAPVYQAQAGDVEDAFSQEEVSASYALSEVDELPRPLEITEPERDAQLMKERGLVRVALLIDETGSVKTCRIINSSNNDLNMVAIKAALKWKFQPAKKDGNPVTVRVGQPIRFK